MKSEVRESGLKFQYFQVAEFSWLIGFTMIGRIMMLALWNVRIFMATRSQKIQGPQDLMTTIGRIQMLGT
ncbi:hypothetical protein B9Z55_015137 [Caenorhabditis nigoni]|uniref:Uncharacterized protein n=1 Tax=Caenorhabditis nigoni TaxID=1611254 RepID=A0A2G5U8W5_9PELO|nr:hypothetical protein B9Z55_015137 [Caenorhabditis nigoni]